MQKRAAYSRENERARGGGGGVPGWNRREGGKQSGKTSAIEMVQVGTPPVQALCDFRQMARPWAESWRGKSASTCEPSPSLPSTQLTCPLPPPIEIRRNDGSCPRECFRPRPPIARERRGGKKNTAWTKIRRKSPFSTWAFLARGAGGEGGSGEGVNACITLRIELFSSWGGGDRTTGPGGKILLARGNVATRAVNPTSLLSCEVLFVNRER